MGNDASTYTTSDSLVVRLTPNRGSVWARAVGPGKAAIVATAAGLPDTATEFVTLPGAAADRRRP